MDYEPGRFVQLETHMECLVRCLSLTCEAKERYFHGLGFVHDIGPDSPLEPRFSNNLFLTQAIVGLFEKFCEHYLCAAKAKVGFPADFCLTMERQGLPDREDIYFHAMMVAACMVENGDDPNEFIRLFEQTVDAINEPAEVT